MSQTPHHDLPVSDADDDVPHDPTTGHDPGRSDEDMERRLTVDPERGDVKG